MILFFFISIYNVQKRLNGKRGRYSINQRYGLITCVNVQTVFVLTTLYLRMTISKVTTTSSLANYKRMKLLIKRTQRAPAQYKTIEQLSFLQYWLFSFCKKCAYDHYLCTEPTNNSGRHGDDIRVCLQTVDIVWIWIRSDLIGFVDVHAGSHRHDVHLNTCNNNNDVLLYFCTSLKTLWPLDPIRWRKQEKNEREKRFNRHFI